MDISVVDANGNVLTHLAYHDVMGSNYGVVPSTGAFCQVTGGKNLLPAGPKGLSRYLPALPHPAYLSIVAWNGEDDSFPSAVHVDAIQFWGTDELQLSLSAPFGPGSIRVENSDGIPNTPYWSVFTLAPGAYPNGWLFGLDITFPELMNQVSFGIPFAGTLRA